MTTQTISPPASAPAPTTVTPPDASWIPVAFPAGAFERWLRKRQRCRGDRRDEVWDGLYMVMPIANNNHQELILNLAIAFKTGIGEASSARVFPGVNVSDNREDWTKNFRCPDIAVYLAGNPAEDRETHGLGGPDFAVEIVSKGDRSRDKFGFYARVGVRELLFVDRKPWNLELYRRDGDAWKLAGRSEPQNSTPFASEVLPLSFRLIAGQPRPRLEITGRDGRGPWLA